jgi:carbonic anhydrase
MCGGEHQSPINIEESKVIPKNDLVKNLTFKYSPRMALSRVANNGHSIQFNFKAGNSILYNGKEFELKQLHFHESSEHTINGKHYPIEIHLVHVSKKGEIAVIGLFGAEGADNQLIETLETFLPIKKGVANDIEQSINLKKFLPKGSAYYSYTGSLTTPPCSEGVNWILFQKPIILSASEVAKMKQDMPSDNFRPTQSLNGRSVYLNH